MRLFACLLQWLYNDYNDLYSMPFFNTGLLSVSEFLDSFRAENFINEALGLAIFIRKAHSSIFTAVHLFAVARQIAALCQTEVWHSSSGQDSRYKAPSSVNETQHFCRGTTSFTMSHSPERMSSYRRHFEGGLTSSSTLQVRVSSPSPTRGAVRHRSASYNRRALSGSRKSRMTR